MKYAGSLVLTLILTPLAHADVSSRVYGGLNVSYQNARTESGTPFDIRSVGARLYPGAVQIKPGQPQFLIDQINGASYLDVNIEESNLDLDEFEPKQTMNTFAGRLVLFNRELFIGAKIRDRESKSGNPDFKLDIDRETELSLGLRRGRLLTRYAYSSYSSQSSLYLGPNNYQFVAYDTYGTESRDVGLHKLGFSWVARTEGKQIFVIESNVYQRSVNYDYRIQEYSTLNIFYPDTGETFEPELIRETELGKDEKSYLGAGVSVSYYPVSDVLLNASWARFPEESPRISVNASVVMKSRFVIGALASAGRKAYRAGLAAGIRF